MLEKKNHLPDNYLTQTRRRTLSKNININVSSCRNFEVTPSNKQL